MGGMVALNDNQRGGGRAQPSTMVVGADRPAGQIGITATEGSPPASQGQTVGQSRNLVDALFQASAWSREDVLVLAAMVQLALVASLVVAEVT